MTKKKSDLEKKIGKLARKKVGPTTAPPIGTPEDSPYAGVTDIVDSAMRKTMAELPQRVREAILSNAAQALGFKCSWGKWEVDHCNGRMSLAHDWIGIEARQAASQAIKDIAGDKDGAIQALVAEVAPGIIQEFKDVFNHTVIYAIRAAAESAAEEYAASFMEQMITVDPVTFKVDIRDPESCATNMGKILTETKIKLIAESDKN